MRIQDVQVGDRFQHPRDRGTSAEARTWITVTKKGKDWVELEGGAAVWGQGALNIAMDEMHYLYFPALPLTMRYPEGI